MGPTYNTSHLRQSLLKQLGAGKEDLYPVELERSFPQVLQRIVDIWHSPELDLYFENLVTTERSDRDGFPETVMMEIFRLSNFHTEYGLTETTNKNPWETSPDRDLSRNR